MRIASILLSILALFLIASPVFAQVPDSLSVQGLITRTNGDPIDSAAVSTTFTLYDGGSSVWSETKAVDISNGVFNTLLGSVTPLGTLPFDRPFRLGIKLDGETSEFSPRIDLANAAYARAIPGMYAFERQSTKHKSRNVIGGADGNSVGGSVTGATIAGGGGILIAGGLFFPNTASGDYGSIGGGINNSAGSEFSTIGGGATNAITGVGATIGGGSANSVNSSDYATIGGGQLNSASGVHATVGGGYSNTASGDSATVAGGRNNVASDTRSTVGGGGSNTASGDFSTIAGGRSNTAEGDSATVGGGTLNAASYDAGTVAGGTANMAYDWGSVGGGEENQATGTYSTVGGGKNNAASGSRSTVGGGEDNVANAISSTVAGGLENMATAGQSTVGGGSGNEASGQYSTVPGGFRNTASARSTVAMGTKSLADDSGSFVFQDTTAENGVGANYNLTTTGPNQFLVRASGGVTFYSNPAPLTSEGVTLASGLGAWASVSDVNAKTDFGRPDPATILDKLSRVPIQTWRYNGESESQTHIGPMAQDFYQAFGFGIDDTHIVTVDADGVALAAIQGLYALVKEQQVEIERLRRMIIDD